MSDKAIETDGHWPLGTANDSGQKVIGCECGWKPARRPERASAQHVPHMAHRRGLKLQPVEYSWPTEDMSRYMTGLSEGGYMRVRSHHWDDGQWVKDGTPAAVTLAQLAKALRRHEGETISQPNALAAALFLEASEASK